MLKIRRSWDRLIFNMGIPMLVRRHLYIETAPRNLTALWHAEKCCIKYIHSFKVSLLGNDREYLHLHLTDIIFLNWRMSNGTQGFKIYIGDWNTNMQWNLLQNRTRIVNHFFGYIWFHRGFHWSRQHRLQLSTRSREISRHFESYLIDIQL